MKTFVFKLYYFKHHKKCDIVKVKSNMSLLILIKRC